jgi:quaternary ammonium compound-resistance protein SugE
MPPRAIERRGPTGIGAVGSFVIGVALLGEPLGVWRIVSVVLVVAGVIGLRLTSANS